MAEAAPYTGDLTPHVIEQELQSIDAFRASDPAKRSKWRIEAYRSIGVNPTDAQAAYEGYRASDLYELSQIQPTGPFNLAYYFGTPGGQQETLETVGQVAKTGGLPTAGSAIGGAIGSGLATGLEALPPLPGPLAPVTSAARFTAPFLPPLGRAAGASLGELINQAAGFTQPNLSDVFRTGAYGLGAESALRLGKGLMALRPARGAEIANEAAYTEAARRIGSMAPTQVADQLYNTLPNYPQPIPLTETFGHLGDIYRRLQVGRPSDVAANRQALAFVGNLALDLQRSGGGLTASKLNRAMIRLRNEITPANTVEEAAFYGTKSTPGILQLLKRDLQRAAVGGHQGAITLSTARQAHARQSLVDELTKALDQKFTPARGAEEAYRFDPAGLIKKIEALDDWKMPQGEKDELVSFLEKLNRRGLLEPKGFTRNWYVASRKIADPVVAGTIGGAAAGSGAYLYGKGDLESAGIGVGTAATTAMVMAVPQFFRNLINASSTRAGRAALTEIVGGNKQWTPKMVSTITSLATAYENNPFSEQFMPPSSRLESPTGPEELRPAGITLTPPPMSQDEMIMQVESIYELPPGLMRSLIAAESNFDWKAQSPKGAMGLTQLMPRTAQEVGVTDPFDPSQSIRGGAQHLSRLIKKYQGDIPKALAAYNAGEGTVERYGGIPPFRETREYVQRVMSGYRQGRREGVE